MLFSVPWQFLFNQGLLQFRSFLNAHQSPDTEIYLIQYTEHPTNQRRNFGDIFRNVSCRQGKVYEYTNLSFSKPVDMTPPNSSLKQIR